MTVKDKVKRRDIQAVTVATLIILVAIAALLIGVADAKWIVAVYVILVGLGLVFIIRSVFLPNEWDFAGPNGSDVSVVAGIIILMVGVVGLISEYLTDNIWVLAAVFLIAIALLIILMVFRNRR